MRLIYRLQHTQDKLEILYIERWLKAPMQQEDGSIVARNCGTPQGGVVRTRAKSD
jgi:RNA-directed DNA polymerase